VPPASTVWTVKPKLAKVFDQLFVFYRAEFGHLGREILLFPTNFNVNIRRPAKMPAFLDSLRGKH